MLTTDQKGNIAEAAVVAEAAKLGVDVYRPVGEGGRYDMIFEVAERLWRVQCKWAPLHGNVIELRCYSSRRNRHGFVRRIYADGEIDAFAAYCHELDTCYFIPYELFGNRVQVALRINPCKNNQNLKINWASDFEFAATLCGLQGAVAQLGERRRGTPKATGSSPVGSIDRMAAVPLFESAHEQPNPSAERALP